MEVCEEEAEASYGWTWQQGRRWRSIGIARNSGGGKGRRLRSVTIARHKNTRSLSPFSHLAFSDRAKSATTPMPSLGHFLCAALLFLHWPWGLPRHCTIPDPEASDTLTGPSSPLAPLQDTHPTIQTLPPHIPTQTEFEDREYSLPDDLRDMSTLNGLGSTDTHTE